MKEKRKSILIISLLCGLAISLSGCAGFSGALDALAKDPACVSASLTTIYGNVKIVRAVPNGTNAITISPDGTITVK